MPSPLVSIIIPTHERPDRLATALESLYAQTYQNWEGIVIVDGSGPDLYTTVAQRAPERVRWFYQPQSGPGVARKRGLAEARGKYAAFLDDDDYYLPGHFAALVAKAEAANHDITRSGLLIKHPNGELEKGLGYRNTAPTLPQYWRAPSNLMALLFRREAAMRVTIDTVRTTIEDFTWLVRVFSHYDVHQCEAYTAVYVMHTGNRNHGSLSPNYLNDRIGAMEAAYDYGEVSAIISQREKKDWIFHQHMHYARHAIRGGAAGAGLRGVVAGLRYFSGRGWRDLSSLGMVLSKWALGKYKE